MTYEFLPFLSASFESCAIIFVLFAIYAYAGMPLILYLATFALYLSKGDHGVIFWSVYLLVTLVLSVSTVRRSLITKGIVGLIKKFGLLPKISETEKIALTSGNTWVDAELFSGKPNFSWIYSQKFPTLTTEEQSFLDHEVEDLCKLCSDYEVQKLRDLPQEVWQYLRDKKFFGIIIPKAHGGLGFSAYAHSCIIEKLASRSVPLAITAMVPNSLGPSELLLHYGTKQQQEYYLPRLADGRELPCFALTEPTVGSDATSITSSGVLFKDDNGEIKIRLNWNKRYITLGAYATVIGVAFQLRDPDKILSNNEEIGITCALVPHTTAGVRQGRRHDPLATPFVNSPLNGENVVIGLDAIIGEKDGLGKGWKMLMECLAAGRGISLPSTSCGGSKLVARSVGAYSALRQQFGMEIAKFEGVSEVLARIAARTYTVDALRRFTAGSVDSGYKPAAVTAIAKYHSTEIFRKIINDGMDVMAGRAIIRGSRNMLANAYFSTPISITVEGANIMTRNLIIFGQGAMLCHPYAYKEVTALEENNLAAFDKAFFAHIKHLIRNTTRSVILSLTRGYAHLPHSSNCLVKKYERKLAWASASFATLSDLAMAMLGGNLKRKEKISARFGDILSGMYLAVCVLKKFETNGYKKEEVETAKYALNEIFENIQKAFDGLYGNLFGESRTAKILVKPFAFFAHWNAFTCATPDSYDYKITKALTRNGAFRDSLTSGIYVNFDKNDPTGRLENALRLHEASLEIVGKIKMAIKSNILPKKKIEALVKLAEEKKVITSDEALVLEESIVATLDAMQVDEYDLEEYRNN